MNKKIKVITTIFVLVLFISISAVAAGSGFYINNDGGLIGVSLSGLYALGSSGSSPLGNGQLYALTSKGIEALIPPIGGGGGGLVEGNKNINVSSGMIKVALNYYYNNYRDSGLAEARLENYVGKGFAFGYYDDLRQFNVVSTTDNTALTIKIIEGNTLGVYVTGTDKLLYTQENTGPWNKLGIYPLSSDEDSITWFSNNKYYGGFEYAVLGNNKITVINVLDIEHYTMGVCSREMSEGWPLEALKAQAVCARTYAQNSVKTSSYYFSGGYDVTGDTYSQAYSGCNLVGPNIIKAVNSTAGEYLCCNGKLTNTMYFSSSGGGTEDNCNVNSTDYPYLKGIIDPYEASVASSNKYSSWTYYKTNWELSNIAGLSYISSVSADYSATGNVIALYLTDPNGKTVTIKKDACRTRLGLPSIHYEVQMNSDGSFKFTGGGWGHNVGMSQFGAMAMAKNYGKTYKDILGFYYTGVYLSVGTSTNITPIIYPQNY